MTETPDAARGGDQSAITTTYTYEPIYNQVHTMTEPRGNDPSYVPQNGGAQSAARYTTTYTYDYQEGTNFAALGAILGISAAAAQARLAAAGIPMGLGDVNGDGLTNQIAGNLIREQDPTVTLLPGSNEAAVEGTTSQPIVTLYTYNQFGQMTSTTDPEGNVTTYTYYPERNPAGTGRDPQPDRQRHHRRLPAADGRGRRVRPRPRLGHQPHAGADHHDLHLRRRRQHDQHDRRPGDRHPVCLQPAQRARRDDPRRPGARQSPPTSRCR